MLLGTYPSPTIPVGFILLVWWQRTVFISKWKINPNKGIVSKTCPELVVRTSRLLDLGSSPSAGRDQHHHGETQGSCNQVPHAPCRNGDNGNFGKYLWTLPGSSSAQFHWHKRGPMLMWQYCNWDPQLEIKLWQTTSPNLTHISLSTLTDALALAGWGRVAATPSDWVWAQFLHEHCSSQPLCKKATAWREMLQHT